MDYHNLPKDVKAEINRKIKESYPEADIDIEQIRVTDIGNGKIRFEYKGIIVELPIGRPDQQTTNDIWKFLTGGAVALAGVVVALWAFNKIKE
ncbi:MAG: hypothetical protein GX945_06335 [Lentisphaerae bacterium]|jgi:hypothetical protein|nr:hypothetical protein [Lentisphaerota bacterium]